MTYLKTIQLYLLSGLFIISLAGCQKEQLSTKEINTVAPEKATEIADSIEAKVPVELADGMELSLWASEKLILDPVGLDIDNKGRLFVTNTTRSWSSEFDIRDHRDWMDTEMAFTTVEDRKKFLHRELAPENSDKNTWLPDRNEDGSHDWKDLTVQKEKVYQVQDLNDDGVADQSQLYIEDFHSEVTDVAGAVLSFQDNVYVGVAPDMWKLQDTDDDGIADKKESISHGYGIHIGFSGHGMSGATYGPDGRIYWSIGDIGFNGKGPNGEHWKYPNQGIIARSDPDGTNFEIFAKGVRNTFEFSFDKYGNLISVDNDGDHPGELERLVYLVKGSDSGWRHNWQYGKYNDENNNPYKVWMDEKMFIPRHESQAAYFIPPIANYHNGPAGMAYNPGTALSDKWDNHFFVAEYTGSTASSRVHAFTLEEQGAGFELETDQVVEQGVLATGMDFGPDGALYFADWIEGWQTNDKGRIWKLDTPETKNSQIRKETKQILGEDFSSRSAEELLEFMSHQDMRVRMKAQFELANRGEQGAKTLQQAAEQSSNQLARLHGIWGIGQLARDKADYADPLVSLLEDNDPRVRAQAAKVIGDVQYEPAAEQLVSLLEDEEARPRFFAAQALGELAYEPATEPIIKMLEANNDEDIYLRHAGTLALAQIGNADPVLALEDNPSRALRIAAVVALRRMQHPGVARFLDDDNEYIVTEAARAINDDYSIDEALPELAETLQQTPFDNQALIRRAINANLRTGGTEATRRLAEYAVNTESPDSMRVEAVSALGVWPNPPELDRVTGRHREKPDLNPQNARDALATVVDPLLNASNDRLKIAAIKSISNLNYTPAVDQVYAHLKSDTNPDVRIAALQGLQSTDFGQIEEAIRVALDDESSEVRMTALSMTPNLDLSDEQVVELLASVLGKGKVNEQQAVLKTLGKMKVESANNTLSEELDKLIAGNYPNALKFDLIQAARETDSETLVQKVQGYEESKPSDDLVAANQELLAGGDPEAGRRVLLSHEAAQCMRCHAVGGNGGNVGPDLAGIGSTLNREQLLESLLDPGARIAPGFGTVTVILNDGEQVSGIIQEETDSMLTLQSADETIHKIEKSNIQDQETAPSSMPPMGQLLEKEQIRNIVEFLSTLK
ncbi:DUF7133 domain-containing protein [Fodinibius salsisoli]|uniref:HEAT repeat domain-containing protein n=1 Tax=Fodinibius salsisoli TaxID=2820877 RepID=A0ABT3PNV2_9BACT|nr:HEAT repeat domain-containing protein [Fodinibius salsisoli]MCW9707543.1 HEAT repeat domain-containing protein [Fodinibius salsisoli]